MPLLAREPDIHPSDLFEHPEVGSETERGWYAVHTKPRGEKGLARRLCKKGIWFYLPQIERKYRSPKGRKCVSYNPLFPSYLFLYGSEEDRYATMTTDSVVRILEVPEGKQLTFDLRQIKQLTDSGAALTPQAQLQPGTQVKVTSGPFVSFEGRVLKHQAGDMLLVVVNYLQQGITISLEDCQVEPV